MKYLVLVLVLLTFNSCSVQKTTPIKFEELPVEVKNLFNEIVEGNRTSAIFCRDTQLDCNCKISSYSLPFIDATVSLESCNKKIKIPLPSTYLRIFVFDENYVYYPDYLNTISFKNEEPILNFIKIDTLRFKKVKL